MRWQFDGFDTSGSELRNKPARCFIVEADEPKGRTGLSSSRAMKWMKNA